MIRPTPTSTLFPYTTLFRSVFTFVRPHVFRYYHAPSRMHVQTYEHVLTNLVREHVATYTRGSVATCARADVRTFRPQYQTPYPLTNLNFPHHSLLPLHPTHV